jgi:hypothetical protein
MPFHRGTVFRLRTAGVAARERRNSRKGVEGRREIHAKTQRRKGKKRGVHI